MKPKPITKTQKSLTVAEKEAGAKLFKLHGHSFKVDGPTSIKFEIANNKSITYKVG